MRPGVEIGEKLFIREKTVRKQLTRFFEKPGVKNRAQAIIRAMDHGFMPDKDSEGRVGPDQRKWLIRETIVFSRERQNK